MVTQAQCITALNTAVEGLKPFLRDEELKTLHASMKSTHEALGRIPGCTSVVSGYTSAGMKVYKAETREIVRRFLARKVSFPNCIAALDAALAALIRRPLTAAQMTQRSGSPDMSEIRAVMLANNETIMDEMTRRELLA
jgi:hypothetical protein